MRACPKLGSTRETQEAEAEAAACGAAESSFVGSPTTFMIIFLYVSATESLSVVLNLRLSKRKLSKASCSPSP